MQTVPAVKQPHKERCAKLQEEFTFLQWHNRRLGVALTSKESSWSLLERSEHWRQGRLAGGTELPLHTRASAQSLSSKHPGNCPHCPGDFPNAK